MKKLPIYLLMSITSLSLAACNQATQTDESSAAAQSESISAKEESIANREAEIKTSESIKAKEESIAKKEAELEKKVASAANESAVSSQQPAASPETANSHSEAQNQIPLTQQINSNLLADYDVQSIEYARILLMTNRVDPNSPIIYVSHSPAGSPVSSYSTGSVPYPYDVTHLYGEYGPSGSITYASHGDGTITIYDLPSHWHQADQSPTGYYNYTKAIVDSAQTVYVDPGYDIDVIQKIESTNFIYQ